MSRLGPAAAGLALLGATACQNNGGAKAAAPSSSAPAASASLGIPSSSAAPVPTRTAGSAGAAAPACTSADLEAVLGPVDSGAGQRHTTLDFRTTKGKACVLTDDLTGFRFLRGDGAPLPTSVSGPSDPHVYVILRPGTVGRLDLTFSVVGGKPFTPHLLKFTVPADGGTDTVAWNAGPVNGDGGIRLGRLHF